MLKFVCELILWHPSVTYFCVMHFARYNTTCPGARQAWVLMGSSTTLSLGSPTTPIRIEVLSYKTTHTFMKWKLWEIWLRNPTASLQFWQGIQHFIQGFSHTQKEESENLKWQIWNRHKMWVHDYCGILFHPYSSMMITLHPFFIHPKTVQKYCGSQYMVILVSK
jgi:hypothetical protein